MFSLIACLLIVPTLMLSSGSAHAEWGQTGKVVWGAVHEEPFGGDMQKAAEMVMSDVESALNCGDAARVLLHCLPAENREAQEELASSVGRLVETLRGICPLELRVAACAKNLNGIVSAEVNVRWEEAGTQSQGGLQVLLATSRHARPRINNIVDILSAIQQIAQGD